MNDSADWPDDMFNSAEIEELQYRFHFVEATAAASASPIKVELTFERAKAEDFLATVQRAPYHPFAAQQILHFVQYIASMVREKLGGADESDR
jgi:hypothetical protein